MPNAVVVFTWESPDLVIEQGGTKYWKLRDWRARECEVVVCVQNQNVGNGEWARPTEPHKSAFLIGHIADVVPSEHGRFMIRIRDFCRINIPDVWQGWRFPVRYLQLSEIGIDPAVLTFEPLPVRESGAEPGIIRASDGDDPPPTGIRPVSLAEAKQGLAATLGVSVDAIEITIRG